MKWLEKLPPGVRKFLIPATCLIILLRFIAVLSQWWPHFAVWHFISVNPVISCLVSLGLGIGITFWFGRPNRLKTDRDITATLTVVSCGLFFGFYLISKACGYAHTDQQSMVVDTAMGWACAYFGIGLLTGFLFGLPRVVQGAGSSTDPKTDSYRQQVNNNLIEISDWLTKIIVGLGLVQLHTVPGHLHRAATWMARSFAPQIDDAKNLPEAAVSFAGAFIVFFSILGFLAGYLITRLYLSGAFGRADQRTVEKDVNSLTALTGDDEANIAKLRNFWRPAGVEDAKNKTDLENWIKTAGIGTVSLVDFLYVPRYADNRKAAVQQFKL